MPRIWSGRSREVADGEAGGEVGGDGGMRLAKEPGF